MSVKNMKIGAPIEYGYLGVKRRMDLILKHVDLKDKTLLDVGCGNGAQTFEFLKSAQNCVAIDVEKDRLRTFQHHLDRELCGQRCGVLQMDASNLSFKDSTFDVICSIETLEHVTKQKKALAEMYRVLKNKGELIISVPNKWWIFETHGANLPYFKWNRVPFFSWIPQKIHEKYAHARIYTQREIIRLISQTGFEIYTVKVMMPPLDKVKNKYVQATFRHVLLKLESTPFKMFGVSIFIFAKKRCSE